MKIEIVIEGPSWLRPVSRLVLPVLAVATAGVALGGVPHAFSPGETLKSADLNGDFNALDTRVTAVETSKTTDQQTIASIQMSILADEQAIATLQMAKTADEQTIASQATSIAQLQAIVGSMKVKNGNNGTVSCDTFCAGSQWGATGTCVGALDTNGGQYVTCSTIPGNTGNQLTCYCSQFHF